MKHRLIIIFMLLAAICLSACGKNTDTSDIEETAPVESTEDPFSLGGIEIDVDTSQTEAETEPAVEVEVLEMLWSSFFVTLVAKKYRLATMLPFVPRMVCDSR